jgi:hypothetical protein
VGGTKVHANASQHADRDYEQIAREILQDAARVDAEEDGRFGDRRGDELPRELSTSPGRAPARLLASPARSSAGDASSHY